MEIWRRGFNISRWQWPHLVYYHTGFFSVKTHVWSPLLCRPGHPGQMAVKASRIVLGITSVALRGKQPYSDILPVTRE